MKNNKLTLSLLGISFVLCAQSASASPEWQTIAGCAQAIAASNSGVYIVGCSGSHLDNNSVYIRGTNAWTPVTTFGVPVATQVGVSNSGDVWVLNKAGSIGQVVGSSVQFLPTGAAVQPAGLAVDSNRNVYVHDTFNHVSEWNGSGWVSLQNGLSNVDWVTAWNTTSTFDVVAAPASGSLYQYFFGWGRVTPAPSGITFAADHEVFAGGSVYTYSDTTNTWTNVGAPAGVTVAQIANQYTFGANPPSTAASNPWAIDTNGNIYSEFNFVP